MSTTQVSDAVLEKISALLRMAEHPNSNQFEASLALERAQALLLRHNLDRTSIDTGMPSGNSEPRPRKRMMDRIEALKKLGTEWEKGGKHRIYFRDLAEWYGLECSYYNTGNVSSASLGGEAISNSRAKRILSELSFAKFWYDFEDDKFHMKDCYGYQGAHMNAIAAAIRAKCDAMISEAA